MKRGLAAILLTTACASNPSTPACETVDVSTFEVAPEDAANYPYRQGVAFIRSAADSSCWGLLSVDSIGGYAGFPVRLRVRGDVPLEYASNFRSATDFARAYGRGSSE